MPKMWEVLKASKGLPVDDPIAALWGQKIAEGWEWQITEITGTLPMLFISDGAALTGYRIYGTAEGAGVETENLLDMADLINAPPGVIGKSDMDAVLALTLRPTTTYTLLSTGFGNSNASDSSDIYRSVYFNGSTRGDCVFAGRPISSISDNDGVIKIGFMKSRTNAQQYINGSAYVCLLEGDHTAAQDDIVPHGYKLPLTVECGDSSAEVPVYIGGSKLGEDEYVDFEEQKIYRDISGILTPTDPPAPLPVIPTFKGENSLSCAERLGEVTVKGKLKEIAGCYVTLADAVLYQDIKARFVLTPSLFDGYTVQAYGIIYDKTGAVTNAEAAKTGLVLGGDYTVKTCASVTGAIFGLNITPIDDNRIWAVGYITFTANGVTTTFYTEPKSAKVSELPTE